jgi:DNA-binding response OmpR family regulator
MRILVIDDSQVARIAMRGMLETAGFTVTEADGGRRGVRTFHSEGADVVLCDLFMPGCNGLEVIGELRRGFPDVKIIAISSGGSGDVLPKARSMGADEILYKPFGPAALVAAIKAVLQRPTWTFASAQAGQNPPAR